MAPCVQDFDLGPDSSRYLASGQSLPPLGGHLVDHLLPELGGELVALGTPPLDDGQNLWERGFSHGPCAAATPPSLTLPPSLP